VIGCETIELAAASGVKAICVETGKTLLLDKEAVINLANEKQITLYGHQV
jgi:DUF1009 family protein